MDVSNPKWKRTPDAVINDQKPRKSNGEDNKRLKIRRVDGECEIEGDHQSVNEAEVEEFFAILRRMRDASSRCPPAGVKDNGVKWIPAFVWEDFQMADGAVKDNGEEKEKEGGEVKEREEEGKGLDLDLNADPEPEGL